jgi:hypothetical protein
MRTRSRVPEPSDDAPLGTFEEQVLLAVLRTAEAA